MYSARTLLVIRSCADWILPWLGTPPPVLFLCLVCPRQLTKTQSGPQGTRRDLQSPGSLPMAPPRCTELPSTFTVPSATPPPQPAPWLPKAWFATSELGTGLLPPEGGRPPWGAKASMATGSNRLRGPGSPHCPLLPEPSFHRTKPQARPQADMHTPLVLVADARALHWPRVPTAARSGTLQQIREPRAPEEQ